MKLISKIFSKILNVIFLHADWLQASISLTLWFGSSVWMFSHPVVHALVLVLSPSPHVTEHSDHSLHSANSGPSKQIMRGLHDLNLTSYDRWYCTNINFRWHKFFWLTLAFGFRMACAVWCLHIRDILNRLQTEITSHCLFLCVRWRPFRFEPKGSQRKCYTSSKFGLHYIQSYLKL